MVSAGLDAARMAVDAFRAQPAALINGPLVALLEALDMIANGFVQHGGSSISVRLHGAAEAAVRSAHAAGTTRELFTIGVAVLLVMVMAMMVVITRRWIGRPWRRRGGAVAAADHRAAGREEGASRAPGQPSAVEIKSSDDLGELATALRTMTQQMRAKAREQRLARDLIAAERDLADSVLEVAGSLILVVVLDREGRIVQFNRACESTTGYRSTEVEGKRVSELFLPPEEVEYAAAAFGERAGTAPDGALPRSFVCTWVGRDDRRHQIAWSNAAVIDKHSGGTHVVAAGIDVTDRRTAQAELREEQERFRLAFDNAPIGMGLVSLDGRFVQVNNALGEMLGRPETELLNLSVTEVTHPGDVQATLQAIANLRTGRTYAWHDEIRYLRADGRVVWGLVSVSVVRRDNGEPFYYLTQIQDITARRSAEERLAQQALRDPLTGLPNRTLLMEQVQRELHRGGRRRRMTGLLCADLDGFKIVNNSLGHHVGDHVLREVSRRLQSAIRPSDTVARVGSDEFVVLCPDVPNQVYLLDVAKRLADSVAKPIVVDGRREVVISMSVGIALGESPDLVADQLVRNANAALYQAKAGGRNGCRLFDESLRQHVIDRARIEEALRQGLRDDHFVLHFEPIVDLATHQVTAVEALLRLNDPTLGLLMPGTFIAIAEDSGLIVPIGAWVLREACRQLARWRDESRGHELLTIAVNVSARQVARPDFADIVAGSLAEANLPPQSLALELTESALMEADIGALRGLTHIRAMGVRLGIDDFGTGYSSFLYLKRLPVGFIKIDQSFVSGLAANPTDRKIVNAIVKLGQALSLTTIAEGVESPEQFAILKDLGCDLAQGYLFGPSRTGPPDLSPPSISLYEPHRFVPAPDAVSARRSRAYLENDATR